MHVKLETTKPLHVLQKVLHLGMRFPPPVGKDRLYVSPTMDEEVASDHDCATKDIPNIKRGKLKHVADTALGLPIFSAKASLLSALIQGAWEFVSEQYFRPDGPWS